MARLFFRAAMAYTSLVGLATSQSMNVDFAPNNSNCEVPGYVRDSGEVFGDRNGFRYGWLQDHTVGNVRQRAPCDALDGPQDASLIILDRDGLHSSFSLWHAEVTAGQYRVTVRYGDAAYPVRSNGCQLNEMNASVGYLPPRVFMEFSAAINVSNDGTLANRIQFGGEWMPDYIEDSCSSVSSIRIELIGTLAPTTSPTISPSAWYDAPGAGENISTLHAQVQALATQLQALGRTVQANQEMIVADIASLRETVGTVADQSAQNHNSAMASIRAVKDAITAAVSQVPNVSRSQTGNVRDSPFVEAIANDVRMVSPRGSVTVESSECSEFDICAVAKALNMLRMP